MFSMLKICALTYSLDIISNPYSVVVFGDSNFKCTIKSFSDKHSPFELQKILDCLLKSSFDFEKTNRKDRKSFVKNVLRNRWKIYC